METFSKVMVCILAPATLFLLYHLFDFHRAVFKTVFKRYSDAKRKEKNA